MITIKQNPTIIENVDVDLDLIGFIVLVVVAVAVLIPVQSNSLMQWSLTATFVTEQSKGLQLRQSVTL